jgi:hypothetical protein
MARSQRHFGGGRSPGKKKGVKGTMVDEEEIDGWDSNIGRNRASGGATEAQVISWEKGSNN